MKLLYISNIAGETAVSSFSKVNVLAAKQLGIEFHLAENFNMTPLKARKIDEEKYGIKTHHVDFVRAPYDLRNIKAFKQVLRIIKNEGIEAIHCNTPVGGVVGRLAGKYCGKKVIYQAHGFHFYNGAPKFNWIVYYPIEKCLARWTDVIITINQEDYSRAQLFHLRNDGNIYYVPGVGIEPASYLQMTDIRNEKRKELGLGDNDIAVISAGDLIERKNYKVSIEAIRKTGNNRIHYYICGKGPLEFELKSLVEKFKISEQVHFLGYRTDVKELFWASDIFLFTTLQEGLPRSLSEAMAAGLPCIASNIRGNTDLIDDGINGYLFEPKDVDGFADAINKMAISNKLRQEIGTHGREKLEEFTIKKVVATVVAIYQKEFELGKVL